MRKEHRSITANGTDGWTLAGLCEIHQRPRQKNGVCPSCYYRQWYEKHREDVLAKTADWKKENRPAHLESKRRWFRKRRLSLHGATIGTYTERDVYERYGRACYICRQPIDPSVSDRGYWHPSLDHVVPISRGGADTLENVRPVHNGCNSHKGRRLLSELAA